MGTNELEDCAVNLENICRRQLHKALDQAISSLLDGLTLGERIAVLGTASDLDTGHFSELLRSVGTPDAELVARDLSNEGVALTQMERRMLEVFCSKGMGEIITYDEMTSKIGGSKATVSRAVLRMKEKLQPTNYDIVSLRKTGWMLVKEGEEANT